MESREIKGDLPKKAILKANFEKLFTKISQLPNLDDETWQLIFKIRYLKKEEYKQDILTKTAVVSDLRDRQNEFKQDVAKNDLTPADIDKIQAPFLRKFSAAEIENALAVSSFLDETNKLFALLLEIVEESSKKIESDELRIFGKEEQINLIRELLKEVDFDKDLLEKIKKIEELLSSTKLDSQFQNQCISNVLLSNFHALIACIEKEKSVLEKKFDSDEKELTDLQQKIIKAKDEKSTTDFINLLNTHISELEAKVNQLKALKQSIPSMQSKLKLLDDQINYLKGVEKEGFFELRQKQFDNEMKFAEIDQLLKSEIDALKKEMATIEDTAGVINSKKSLLKRHQHVLENLQKKYLYKNILEVATATATPWELTKQPDNVPLDEKLKEEKHSPWFIKFDDIRTALNQNDLNKAFYAFKNLGKIRGAIPKFFMHPVPTLALINQLQIELFRGKKFDMELYQELIRFADMIGVDLFKAQISLHPVDTPDKLFDKPPRYPVKQVLEVKEQVRGFPDLAEFEKLAYAVLVHHGYMYPYIGEIPAGQLIPDLVKNIRIDHLGQSLDFLVKQKIATKETVQILQTKLLDYQLSHPDEVAAHYYPKGSLKEDSVEFLAKKQVMGILYIIEHTSWKYRSKKDKKNKIPPWIFMIGSKVIEMDKEGMEWSNIVLELQKLAHHDKTKSLDEESMKLKQALTDQALQALLSKLDQEYSDQESKAAEPELKLAEAVEPELKLAETKEPIVAGSKAEVIKAEFVALFKKMASMFENKEVTVELLQLVFDLKHDATLAAKLGISQDQMQEVLKLSQFLDEIHQLYQKVNLFYVEAYNSIDKSKPITHEEIGVEKLVPFYSAILADMPELKSAMLTKNLIKIIDMIFATQSKLLLGELGYSLGTLNSSLDALRYFDPVNEIVIEDQINKLKKDINELNEYKTNNENIKKQHVDLLSKLQKKLRDLQYQKDNPEQIQKDNLEQIKLLQVLKGLPEEKSQINITAYEQGSVTTAVEVLEKAKELKNEKYEKDFHLLEEEAKRMLGDYKNLYNEMIVELIHENERQEESKRFADKISELKSILSELALANYAFIPKDPERLSAMYIAFHSACADLSVEYVNRKIAAEFPLKNQLNDESALQEHAKSNEKFKLLLDKRDVLIESKKILEGKAVSDAQDKKEQKGDAKQVMKDSSQKRLVSFYEYHQKKVEPTLAKHRTKVGRFFSTLLYIISLTFKSWKAKTSTTQSVQKISLFAQKTLQGPPKVASQRMKNP